MDNQITYPYIEEFLNELENEMNNPNFWDDKKHSEEVLNELNFLKSKI